MREKAGVEKQIERRLLSVKELSKYTGLAIDTIYEWVHCHKLKHLKIGRLIKFDRKDVDGMIEELKVQSEKIN